MKKKNAIQITYIRWIHARVRVRVCSKLKQMKSVKEIEIDEFVYDEQVNNKKEQFNRALNESDQNETEND